MSIRRGNNVIASSGANGLQLLDFKWSDHVINDLNWILSSSSSWHSGNTYKKLYNHLVEDYHNGVDETEVIDSYTISYKLAPDGHKIVDAISSGVVDNIYNATGVAWYYILDTTTHQFKLPKTKYAFDSGTTSEIGKYVPESLPNIKGRLQVNRLYDDDYIYIEEGCLSVDKSTSSAGTIPNYYSASSNHPMNIDASKSSSTYQDDAPVQPPATKMLLYFYTAQFAGSGSGGGGSISIVYDDTNKRLIFGE